MVRTAAILSCALISLPAAAQNLLLNPGFESGQSPWFTFGTPTVAIGPAHAHSGTSGLGLSNRTAPWNAIAQNIRPFVLPGATYIASGYIRVNAPGTHTVILTLKVTDASGEHFTGLNYQTIPGNTWVLLDGTFTFTPNGTATEVFLYAEGPEAGISFSFDDASLQRESTAWKAQANARIAQLRTRACRVVVTDAFGAPVPDASITADQIDHDFAFGTAISHSALNDPRYTQLLTRWFEWGVPEYECKWHYTQPTPAPESFTDCDAVVNFANANGLRLRGHNVFWEVAEFCPPWLATRTNTALQSAMLTHMQSIIPRYASSFRHWDINNEMIHGDFFSSRVGEPIWTWMYQQARLLDPDCQLFVNDYNNIDGSESQPFQSQIAQLLAAGAPIDGIGLQGHFVDRISAQRVQLHLDAFATFNLPLWITEYDCVNADPVRRADNLENLYRMAFSHPAVHGIMMWGFWAGAHWRGADGALVDLDWTINAAGLRYESLLNEWTTRTAGTLSTSGEFSFTGYHGTYDLTVFTPNGPSTSKRVHLESGSGTQTFTIALPLPCIADFNLDGGIDGSDIEAFFNAWVNGDGPADVNADGGVDGADVATFFIAWEAGAC